MPIDKFLHNDAKIKVHDNVEDRDRTYKLSIQDQWGFIGDDKENELTEMNIPHNKLSLSNLKKMFDGDYYPIRYDEKSASEPYADDSGREHMWAKTGNGTYVEQVRDPEIAKRYQLLDVLENDKSILPQSSGHFLEDPEVNKPAYIIDDATDEVSGPITPTTKKALSNLKSAVNNDLLELKVGKDSELQFAGNLPSGNLTNGSKLVVNKGASVKQVKLDNSSIVCDKGQIVNSTFKDSNIYYKDVEAATHDPLDRYENEHYIYNSNFNHVNMFRRCSINSSIIDYAALNYVVIKDSTLKGGNYNNCAIDHVNTWLTPQSQLVSSELKNTRIENRRLSMDDYQASADQIAKSIDEMLDDDKISMSDTMISDAVLDNTQILSNENVGSTIASSNFKNTFVKEWITADKSKVIAKKPTKPILIGKVSLKNNELQFTDVATSFNLDEYSSEEAQNGLELPENTDYNDVTLKNNDEHIVKINNKSKSMKQLTKLDHGHYILNNGDDAFDNLANVLGDDGGKHLELKQTKAKTLDGPEP